MLKVYDFYCSNCEAMEERFVADGDQDRQVCTECDDSAYMIRLPAGPTTDFKFADR